MQKLLILISLTVFSSFCCYSAGIRGRVTDAHTGEALAGVAIQVKELNRGTITGLDGSFELKHISKGRYTVVANGISYTAYTKTVEVDESVVLDISLVPANESLQSVTVAISRSSGATDAGARQLEKISDNVENILSTHQLLLMPDVTVASVLRRVSGVTVDRGEDGEGRYPVIRGMDKRYNYTLINGIKIPSPDDKNRYVPMDIFPSEMLQRLEVIKSLTPDMEGDAIGGVMNLVMKDPPAHLTVNAQGAVGYSQMLFNQSFIGYPHGAVNSQAPNETKGSGYTPSYSDFSTQNLVFSHQHPLPDGQLGLTLGNRYLNNRLGVILSGSVQSTSRITKDQFFSLSPQPDPHPDSSLPLMTNEEHRTYYTHEDRIGLHAKLDYHLGQHSRISLYSVYMRLNTYQTRMITDTADDAPLGNGSGSKDVSFLSRSRSNFQSVYNATLQGQHSIGRHLTVDWSAVYSHAGQQLPDRAELTLQQVFGDTAGQLRPHYAPEISGLERLWQHNSDQDVAGYLNLHYTFHVGDNAFDIGAGGMARHKERNNYYIDYKFTPLTPATFTTLPNAPFYLSTYTVESPNDYTATEDVEAGYGEVRWKRDRWNVLAGVRFENTHQSYDQTTLDPNTAVAKTGTVTYLDPLPSLQVKYQLNGKAALHLAYFSSISRPGFFEIVPYDFPGEYYDEIGNPNLRHTKARNVDLRYELFPGLNDQFLVGAFYKNIVNPIEYVYARPATSESAIQPQNVGTANNFGGELVYTHYWNKFGVSANYTYTHSNIPTVYKYYYVPPATGSPTSVLLTKDRPLQGQAAHIGNISLLYKDPKSGIELQLATIYTGKHIVYLSQYGTPDNSMDYWQRGTTVLDFSGEKTLGRHFSVYIKLNNLLNTRDIVEIYYPPTPNIKATFPDAAGRSDRTLVEKKSFGQTYLAGIRYHL